MNGRFCSCAIALLSLASTPALAQGDGDGLEWTLGGFMRAETGFGDRYGNATDEDTTGISRAALAISSKYENITGFFAIGGELMSSTDANENGNIDIKDAFVTINELGNGFSVTLGAQPLLFGLKPNGYPADRSLIGSLEYGAGGAFAVSNQAGPAIVGAWQANDGNRIRFGIFDQRDYQNSGTLPPAAASSGSGMSGNYFLQWNSRDLFDSGIYFAAGVESRYVGGTVDDDQSIWFVGAGWANEMFDVSLEHTSLDAAFNGTADDEAYLVTELTWHVPDSPWSVYLDYADADELDLQTLRLGSMRRLNDHFDFAAEYAQDDIGASDVDSIVLRLQLTY